MFRLIEYLLARGLVAALGAIPYETGLRISRAVAHAAYRFASGPRELTLRHLRLAYGEELSERRAHEIARGVFETLCRQVIEGAHLLREGTRGLRIENGELMKKAYAEGRGVIMVSAHFGCFLRMAMLPRALNVAGGVIMKKQQNRRLLDWGTRYMKHHFDLDVIHKKRSRGEIMDFLRAGKVVGFFADQHPRRGGFPAIFFGRRILAAKGPAVYAKRIGCPIVVLTSVIDRDGTNVLRFEGPVDSGGTHEEISQAWVSLLERRIREYPEQWTWMHRRWRHEHLGELDEAAWRTAENPV